MCGRELNEIKDAVSNSSQCEILFTGSDLLENLNGRRRLRTRKKPTVSEILLLLSFNFLSWVSHDSSSWLVAKVLLLLLSPCCLVGFFSAATIAGLITGLRVCLSAQLWSTSFLFLCSLHGAFEVRMGYSMLDPWPVVTSLLCLYQKMLV